MRPVLTKHTKTLLFHAWRMHRTLDVMLYIEEDLTLQQATVVGWFLEWLPKQEPKPALNEGTIDALFDRMMTEREAR